jgi:colanic acid/amylovoran biosynthesis glycosyltransferase
LPDGGRPERSVVLLFTTFPTPSETFLQREVRALHDQQRPFVVWSLWGRLSSSRSSLWRGVVIHHFPFVSLLTLLWWLPYWLVRRPAAMRGIAARLFDRDWGNLWQFGENLMGYGAGLCLARTLERQGHGHVHGVWATLPAACAHIVHSLTGIGWSFGAHAYDIYEAGGDALLRPKARSAAFVRTSTETGRLRLRRLGVDDSRVAMVRRGLLELPPWRDKAGASPHLALLSVGRLVEKMGYFQQIQLLCALRERGVPFSAYWIGGGPQEAALRAAVRRHGLEDCVTFGGVQAFGEVAAALARADIFLFSGIVARNGDRAGLPNAVAEAMAWGVPVVASPVGAVAEAIIDGKTGILARGNAAVDAIVRLRNEPAYYQAIRVEARRWTENQYRASSNMDRLWELWQQA